MNGPENHHDRPLRVCEQCGFTYAEFQARGLLGCAFCYAHMGDALLTDMLHLHPRLHRRAPGGYGGHRRGASTDGAALIAALRERLSDALRRERYEEAALLQRQLDDLPGDAARTAAPGAP